MEQMDLNAGNGPAVNTEAEIENCEVHPALPGSLASPPRPWNRYNCIEVTPPLQRRVLDESKYPTSPAKEDAPPFTKGASPVKEEAPDSHKGASPVKKEVPTFNLGAAPVKKDAPEFNLETAPVKDSPPLNNGATEPPQKSPIFDYTKVQHSEPNPATVNAAVARFDSATITTEAEQAQREYAKVCPGAGASLMVVAERKLRGSRFEEFIDPAALLEARRQGGAFARAQGESLLLHYQEMLTDVKAATATAARRTLEAFANLALEDPTPEERSAAIAVMANIAAKGGSKYIRAALRAGLRNARIVLDGKEAFLEEVNAAKAQHTADGNSALEDPALQERNIAALKAELADVEAEMALSSTGASPVANIEAETADQARTESEGSEADSIEKYIAMFDAASPAEAAQLWASLKTDPRNANIGMDDIEASYERKQEVNAANAVRASQEVGSFKKSFLEAFNEAKAARASQEVAPLKMDVQGLHSPPAGAKIDPETLDLVARLGAASSESETEGIDAATAAMDRLEAAVSVPEDDFDETKEIVDETNNACVTAMARFKAASTTAEVQQAQRDFIATYRGTEAPLGVRFEAFAALSRLEPNPKENEETDSDRDLEMSEAAMDEAVADATASMAQLEAADDAKLDLEGEVNTAVDRYYTQEEYSALLPRGAGAALDKAAAAAAVVGHLKAATKKAWDEEEHLPADEWMKAQEKRMVASVAWFTAAITEGRLAPIEAKDINPSSINASSECAAQIELNKASAYLAHVNATASAAVIRIMHAATEAEGNEANLTLTRTTADKLVALARYEAANTAFMAEMVTGVPGVTVEKIKVAAAEDVVKIETGKLVSGLAGASLERISVTLKATVAHFKASAKQVNAVIAEKELMSHLARALLDHMEPAVGRLTAGLASLKAANNPLKVIAAQRVVDAENETLRPINAALDRLAKQHSLRAVQARQWLEEKDTRGVLEKVAALDDKPGYLPLQRAPSPTPWHRADCGEVTPPLQRKVLDESKNPTSPAKQDAPSFVTHAPDERWSVFDCMLYYLNGVYVEPADAAYAFRTNTNWRAAAYHAMEETEAQMAREHAEESNADWAYVQRCLDAAINSALNPSAVIPEFAEAIAAQQAAEALKYGVSLEQVMAFNKKAATRFVAAQAEAKEEEQDWTLDQQREATRNRFAAANTWFEEALTEVGKAKKGEAGTTEPEPEMAADLTGKQEIAGASSSSSTGADAATRNERESR